MITFKELCEQMHGKHIPYPMLLTTVEWNEKRNLILDRDHHHCTQCGKGETMDDYDEVNHKTFYFWFHLHKRHTWVKQEDGTYVWGDDVDFEVADKPYHMQVHHKRYILNRFPWEYDDSDLVTLCNWCHWEFHEHNTVEVFAKDGVTLLKDLEVCRRCHGVGSFPEYSHVYSGICFRCGGERYEQPLVKVMS